MRRLLFTSNHAYLDPSSGAALATRDLWELLATQDCDCRALTAGLLEYDEETTLAAILEAHELSFDSALVDLSDGRDAPVYDMTFNGVRLTMQPRASSRAEHAPSYAEARVFLDLITLVLERFRPDLILTYGAQRTNLEMMRLARRDGIPVVFHLHNFACTDPTAFENVSAILFPSEFARRHYAGTLGLEGTAIPYPIRADRVVSVDPEPRYLTFVNPQPSKGAAVFARIAHELDQRRPDIPILIVEGRASVEGLTRVPLDLSGLTNLYRMANTVDPRDFYRVSRAVLMPSVGLESFGRVAAESLANGIPVLASDRGALPETLGRAGIILPIPDHCTAEVTTVPTAGEVAPWIEAIERLWDDPAFETEHKHRARAEAQRWEASRIAEQYLAFFDGLIRRRTE